MNSKHSLDFLDFS